MTEPYAAADALVRVYPASDPQGVGLVWAHGGGFAAGDLDMHEADGVARDLAARGTTVISVDYRLVGEGCRYPAPSDDILAAWDWVLGAAGDLGIERFAIGGASAGANLVTGAVLRLLAADGPLPSLVVLAYPTLLAVQPEPAADLRAALDADPDADRFSPAVVRAMYEDFLGGPVDDAPPAAVPGLAEPDDVAGFPPVLMINGDVDELRVSGEVFAATLAAAGRDVEVVIEHGTTHGHLNIPGPAASASLDLIATRLAALASSDSVSTDTVSEGTPS
ncbi:alpha/beta hydrolase fold domain-containing protein [Microbacterium sp. SLBN-146]|uniref:alpha/beta hydrolase fold domain-containing protein n=1 Tax=Microbacterium sp. SLBN-146 TaxID=2768457 RepID=UPI001152C688|nr:alpha/beta hydrolase fold domain-containing protein [Microbacterium sp. SLBN-146]TQJ30098.1 acetyl esterase/lipase [Microbacterium sp. SLBN-146]